MSIWDRGKQPFKASRPCAKCGHTLVESRHITTTISALPDMVRRICQRCDYTWDEIPLDRASQLEER